MRVNVIFFLLFFAAGTAVFPAEKNLEWFWMIYEKEAHEKNELFVIRPFYLQNRNFNPQYDFKASLMPVIFWRYEKGKASQTYGFFGLINSVDYKSASGEDYDLNLFPMLYYGSGNESKDSYFLLWPLGGSIKGKFAHEEIGAYLFPGVLLFYFFPPSGIFTLKTSLYVAASFIPVYSTFKDKEYRGWSLLWPLIKYGSSPARSDLRILPFYSNNKKSGWYESSSYALIVNYSEQYFSKDTRYTLFVFPFYGRKWSDSGRISSTTLLWPFFSWGYDRSNRDYQYNLPWPLVQLRDSESPDIKKRIFFPFYGYYRYAETETVFVTPLYFNLKKNQETYSSDYYTIALIASYYKRDYKTGDPVYGNSWRYYKLWPLISYEYSSSGALKINFLSMLPFRDESGYEQMYEPLWSIFEYKRSASGDSRLGLLMRTYYQRSAGEIFDMRIPILFSYFTKGDEYSEVSILTGFIKSIRHGKARRINIFWLPVYKTDKMLTKNGYELKSADNTDSGDGIFLKYPHWNELAGLDCHVEKIKYSYRF